MSDALIMTERHELGLDAFTVAVVCDDQGEAEVVFSRGGKTLFRAAASELRDALTFVEKHGDIQVVQR